MFKTLARLISRFSKVKFHSALIHERHESNFIDRYTCMYTCTLIRTHYHVLCTLYIKFKYRVYTSESFEAEVSATREIYMKKYRNLYRSRVIRDVTRGVAVLDTYSFMTKLK